MADELGVQRPTTFSQRDETGMTRAILPLLKKHNITMISLVSINTTISGPLEDGSQPAPLLSFMLTCALF